MKSKLAFLVYEIPDPGCFEDTVSFYTDVLKMQDVTGKYRTDKARGSACLETPDGKCLVLRINENKVPLRKNNFHGSWDVNSCCAVANYLASKGYPIYANPPLMGGKAVELPFSVGQGLCGCFNVFTFDPAGNTIEFHETTPKSLQFVSKEEIERIKPKIEAAMWVDTDNTPEPSELINMPYLRFEHIGIGRVGSFEATYEFYKKLGISLHFELKTREGFHIISYLKNDSEFSFLETVAPPEDISIAKNNGRCFGLLVSDLKAAVEELHEADIAVSHREGIPFVQDADGNTIELWEE